MFIYEERGSRICKRHGQTEIVLGTLQVAVRENEMRNRNCYCFNLDQMSGKERAFITNLTSNQLSPSLLMILIIDR